VATADELRVQSPSRDVVADISAAMARQGFDPEVRAVRDGAEIVLHRCPFATSAIADRDTVCALHLGIAEGLAAGTRATVSELVAYDPRKADCRLRIRVASDDAVAPSDRGTLSLRGRSSRR
jgi:predicted ArsR family transcriptional regulator